jgi:hypothetical protein
LELEVEVHVHQVAGILGLILAACQGTPEGFAARVRRPLKICLILWGDKSNWATGLRDAYDLAAPLRSLAEFAALQRRTSQAVFYKKPRQTPLMWCDVWQN